MSTLHTATDESAMARAGRVVEEFLEASMAPDPVRARSFMAPDVKITFTGGRRFDDPAGTTAFNAARYRWVKKKFERTDVAAGAADDEVVVYNTGRSMANGRTGSRSRAIATSTASSCAAAGS